MTPAHCTGAILAGGRATRYGGAPKGLELVGGRRIIDRVASGLRSCTSDLLLVANDPASDSWMPGVRVVGDIIPDAGSLGGIHAALTHAGRAVLAVAWDMPFVPETLLRALITAGADADVVVPESGSKRGVEPLCAYYGPACIAAIERRLAAGDHRVIGFYDDVRAVHLPAAEVARFGDPGVMFMNVNSPDELGQAELHVATPDAGGRRAQA